MRDFNQIRLDVYREIQECFLGIAQDSLDSLLQEILAAGRIFICGKGREDIPCKGFCMRLNHLGLEAYHIGDPCTPAIEKKDLLILSARETITTARTYLDAARNAGAKVVFITSNFSLEDMDGTTHIVKLPLPKTSIQPYGAVYEQVLWLAFDYVEYMLQEFVGGDEQQRVRRHANIL